MRKHLLVVLAIPCLFVAIAIGYNPFGMLARCDFGHLTPYVHIVLMGCVLLLTLLLSRLVYFFVERKINIHWWNDMIWCILETLAASFFMAMYMSLFSHQQYFDCLGRAVQYIYLILFFPYVTFALIDNIATREEREKEEQEQENVIHFYDENKHLKLVIAANSVLYIKADDNSVKINYLDSGKLKVFALRISMRKLEPIAEKYNLVRCQRSYYVNPSHVKVLRKDKDGFIFADMGLEDVNPIPVSKTYYNNLASIM